MAKYTQASFPLASLKANIGVLESTRVEKPDKRNKESFKMYYDMYITETLKELGETARGDSLDNCLEDLKKILDKRKEPVLDDLNFRTGEE